MQKLIISGCVLERNGYACPEQYDVFFGDFQIGYLRLRLRHGTFTANYPDCGGETAYKAYPKGDGIFEDEERMLFLKEAVDSLVALHNNKIIEQVNSQYYW